MSRSAGIAERRPNTGSTRLGASAASDASCLATNTGWRPGSTATDVPTFRLRGAGQRERHADERVHRLRVHQFGEPQRIDAGRLQMVDDRRQFLWAGIGSQPDAEPNLHPRLLGSRGQCYGNAV